MSSTTDPREPRLLDAPIDEVTVFADRARITRRARVALEPGLHTLRFAGLTPALDEGSLRARAIGADGGTRVAGLTAGWEAHTEPARDEVAGLQRERDELQRQVEQREDRLRVGQAGRQLLDHYRELAREAIGRHAATGEETPERWAAACAFVGERIDADDAARGALQGELRELHEQRDALDARLARLQAPDARRTRTAELRVRVATASEVELSLDYVVHDAAWHPAYEVRHAGDGPLALTVHATVEQGSGEAWPGVRLVLSTARPGESAQAPRLTPLRLTALPKRREPVTVRSYGARRDRDDDDTDRFEANAAAPPPQPGKPRARAAVDSGDTAVRFEVIGAETIPADRRPHKVTLATAELDAELTFKAIPKIEPWVHREARCRNTTGAPLLPGPVDVFGASGFVGRGQLEHVAPDERFSLSLGTEEGIRVRRLADERVDRAPRLLGSKRTIAHAYRIEVDNRQAEPATVALVENLPVSQREEIDVALDDRTRPDERDDDGFLRWTLTLEPGETRTVPFGFTVRYPKDWQIEGF